MLKLLSQSRDDRILHLEFFRMREIFNRYWKSLISIFGSVIVRAFSAYMAVCVAWWPCIWARLLCQMAILWELFQGLSDDTTLLAMGWHGHNIAHVERLLLQFHDFDLQSPLRRGSRSWGGPIIPGCKIYMEHLFLNLVWPDVILNWLNQAGNPLGVEVKWIEAMLMNQGIDGRKMRENFTTLSVKAVLTDVCF